MTTQSWSSVIDHTSDAAFRAWGGELSAKFAAAGLVQTADTGQINWTTVTRAGVNADAGYEIWRFNDTQQGTAPIYFRINYGTGSATTVPRLQMILGTSSNGSGTIGGATVTGTITIRAGNQGTVSTVIAYQSWLCVADGFCGLVFKQNAITSSGSGVLAMGGFIICRSCDGDGVPTAEGAAFLHQNGQANQAVAGTIQNIRYAATAALYTASTQAPIFIPGSQTNSAVGSNVQAYLGWMLTPQVRPIFGVCGMFTSELGEGSTMTTTLVGSTPHTYISVGRQICTYISSNDATLKTLCMLWE